MFYFFLAATPMKQDSITSPSVEATPGFNVDTDVLARSPMGSVTDLSQIQSDNESVAGENVVNKAAVETDQESIGPKSLETTAQPQEEAAPNEATETDHAAVNKEQEQEQQESQIKLTVTSPKGTETDGKATPVAKAEASQVEDKDKEFTNAQGVTFTPTSEMVDETGSLIPYGLPCVRELFRFLITLINPYEGVGSVANQAANSTTVGGITFHNDSMMQVALSLLTTALETGAEHLDKFESLLDLVKDDLARNLVSLLASERVATFNATLWISYLVFSQQRQHLKYQMEIFLNRLIEIVNSESNHVTYEHKELVLDLIVRLYKMPDFITQLYVNYDCDMFTHNLFEDLTKMLSKNAYPVTGLYSTQFLSLDALLTVVEAIGMAYCLHFHFF